MNTDTELGASYLKTLSTLKIGDSLEMQTIAPGVSSEPTVGVLVGLKPLERWDFEMFWHNIKIGSVSAKLDGKMLLFKEEINGSGK